MGKFNKISLREKEDLYSYINMEDITDADYAHAKRVCKDFEIKNLGEYHDLYFQSISLLLGDVFGNFRNMCLKINALDPSKFLSVSKLAWQAALIFWCVLRSVTTAHGTRPPTMHKLGLDQGFFGENEVHYIGE